MAKLGLGKNVYEAAVERTKWTFDNFERVYLSFSAGKDSTVMLHIAALEARERGVKLGLLLVDLEGQYKMTIHHAQEMLKEYSDVLDVYWICLPFNLISLGLINSNLSQSQFNHCELVHMSLAQVFLHIHN